jgi:O-antigen/teichoic acid export membrane protein
VDPIWGRDDSQWALMARNISTRYVAIVIESVLGLLLLPFNVAHLGPSAYGLWALTASVTIYFSVLDLGYGGALVKFVAQYRALRDRKALNEILSTLFVVFTGAGLATFAATAVVAWQFDRVFNVQPDQVETGRRLLLFIGAFVAIRFALSIYGGLVYGFQRYYLNNGISIATSLAAAGVNVAVLSSGYGLVPLVALTTVVRIVALGGFAWTAYRVFPGLQVDPRLFRRARLREATGFSVYMLVLDWSSKLNYSADALVIGAFLSTSAVAVWTVGQRLAEVVARITNQLNDALFPLVVDSDAVQQTARLQQLVLEATRLSLALAVPVCLGVAMLAPAIIEGWLGRSFGESAIVARLLLSVVLIKVGCAGATSVLKGAGHHRLLAFTNATTAIVNVLMSIALIKRFGLAGVAVGTLIPVGLAGVFVLFPAACRRVGLGLVHTLRVAVWPAVWPGVLMAAVVHAGAGPAGTNLRYLALLLVVAGAVYQVAFFGLALSAADRQLYWSKLHELVRRRRAMPAAA